MANPQAENGHIDIANELAEALAKIRISGEEWQVLWVILRKTWGWHKKMDNISFSQLEHATGLKRASVFRAIKKLLTKNIIVSNKANSYVVSYGIQKDYDKWKPLAKKLTLLAIKQRGISNKANETISIFTEHKRKKETNTKENILLDKPKKKKVKVLTEHQKLVEEFKSKYQIRYNAKYLPTKPDWVSSERLVRELTYPECLRRLNNAFTYKYFFDCRTFGDFVSHINRLVNKPEEKEQKQDLSGRNEENTEYKGERLLGGNNE
jgi:phage replication O-like protein O